MEFLGQGDISIHRIFQKLCMLFIKIPPHCDSIYKNCASVLDRQVSNLDFLHICLCCSSGASCAIVGVMVGEL